MNWVMYASNLHIFGEINLYPFIILQNWKFTILAINILQEFKGYVFKIMGGCDKQGFPMKQGCLTPGRVRLLLPRGY